MTCIALVSGAVLAAGGVVFTIPAAHGIGSGSEPATTFVYACQMRGSVIWTEN